MNVKSNAHHAAMTDFLLLLRCLLLQGKLGMDRSVRLENLMVSHFLSAMDRLADPSLLQFVKHLQSRAQGEVSAMFVHFCTVRF